MTKLKRLWPVFVLLAAGIGFAAWYYPSHQKPVPIISNAIELVKDKTDDKTQDQPIEFKNYGPAPELKGVTKWLNGDPQTLANLKGKVVVLDFWTYASINVSKTIPYLNKWQQDYQANGLQIIGVHTPQFNFEKITDNVQNFIKTHPLQFPVAQDNDYKVWTAYKNQFWPALYLIDRDGNIVYTYYGEGNYAEIEKAVRQVLGLDGTYTSPPLAEQNQAHTPEINLGSAKQNGFGNSEKPDSGEQIYIYPKKLGDSKFAVEGRWQFSQEAAVHTRGFGRLKLNFDAAKVFLVAQSNSPVTIKVYVDGTLIKGVVVRNRDLYQLYDSISGGKHTLEIEIPEGGFQAFTFTFS